MVFFGGLNPACGGINIHYQILIILFIFIRSAMKNICIIILPISILTVTNESTYAQAINSLQVADSFYIIKDWADVKKIYLKYLGDTSIISTGIPFVSIRT